MLNVKNDILLNLETFSKLLNSLDILKSKSAVAVSVSAGVDSMSLLHLSDKWAKKNEKSLYIISYNHNIRKESKQEVEFVKLESKKLGWKHKSLKWERPSKKNILEKARNARYKAISEFCRKKNIDVLFLGHHLDDLIETFFIRILKKSKLEGLCPMIINRKIFGINMVRPLLNFSKKTIYHYARQHNIKFFEDPSNYSDMYIRTKVRMFLSKNEDMKYNLVKSVKLFCGLRLYFGKHILKFFLDNVVLKDEGYIIINKKNLLKLPNFLISKILEKGIISVGNRKYPPRSSILNKLTEILVKNTVTTISVGGCLIKVQNEILLILREFNCIKNLSLILNKGEEGVWDNKFVISNLSKDSKMSVSALGSELKDSNLFKLYSSKKKSKHLDYNLKKTLPVIKTLEGYAYIPHLNIYNNLILKNNVRVRSVDFCEFKD